MEAASRNLKDLNNDRIDKNTDLCVMARDTLQIKIVE